MRSLCLSFLPLTGLSSASGDHNYIKANTKFFAVPYRGVGSLAVIPYERTGKQAPNFPMIQGHKGKVLDFDFNPFHEPVVTGVRSVLIATISRPAGFSLFSRRIVPGTSSHPRARTAP